MASFGQNLRYTARVLRKSPGFTAVAIFSLALGIGANTAVFSLLDALLLRDLPVREPERLVELSVVRRGDKIMFSYPMFRVIERGQKVFSGLIGWSFGEMANVELNGELSQADVRSVTGNYYSELGAVPLLGRLIAPEDIDSAGGTSPVAVLSFEFWQRRFGGAANVVGKEIAIEGQPFTIVGVTRRWFTGMSAGEAPDVTIPLKSTDERSRLWVFITGRLKDGVTLAQARAQLESLWPEILRATTPTEAPGLRRQLFFSMGLDVSPAATGINRRLRSHFSRPLFLLMGMVGLILLAACVNLANLMLARAAARSHEMSVRAALGASRGTLVRQVLTESLALSACGALLGLALAYLGSRLLVSLLTEGSLTPIVLDLRPDWRVLSFTGLAAILTGILFGLAPAWRCAREDPISVLQQNPRSVAGAAGKLGKALIVSQVALSLVLLMGAGLLVGSFRKLTSADLGFQKERVLEVHLFPRPGGYQDLDASAYHQQLTERIASLPGVDSEGFSDVAVGSDQRWQDKVSTMEDTASPSAGFMASAAMISPDFFRTLGISIVRGRDFNWNDDEHHPRVAILSSSLAQKLFPSGNALGQQIRFSFMPELQGLEVVGVAGNARLFDLHDASAPVIYLPSLQVLKSEPWAYLFVRTRESPETVARAVGKEVASLGREYPLSTETVSEEISQALVEERAIAWLSTFFAGLALLLASVGLYGLMSYGVTRRTREIGVRMALGARAASVRWAVLRETLALALAGIALGIPCALASSRLIAGMLFGISPGDLPTTASISALLLVVALAAGYLPARRASRVDPAVALRAE